MSLVDAFPTILELAGCSPKRSCFGKSLMPLVRDPAGRVHDAVFSEIDARTMIRDERFKMVVDTRGTVLKLYDMSADPAEAMNLVGRHEMADTICRLRSRLLTWHLATPSRQQE